MIQAGFRMVSPLTQSRTVVTAAIVETGGAGFTIEVTCTPGMGPNVLEHLHETWTETFEILSGSAQYRLGGKHLKAHAGETIVMPPRVPHVHPWDAGEGEMVHRQTSRFERPSREAGACRGGVGVSGGVRTVRDRAGGDVAVSALRSCTGTFSERRPAAEARYVGPRGGNA